MKSFLALPLLLTALTDSAWASGTGNIDYGQLLTSGYGIFALIRNNFV